MDSFHLSTSWTLAKTNSVLRHTVPGERCTWSFKDVAWTVLNLIKENFSQYILIYPLLNISGNTFLVPGQRNPDRHLLSFLHYTLSMMGNPKELGPHWLKSCSGRRNSAVRCRSHQSGWSCIFKNLAVRQRLSIWKWPLTSKVFIKHDLPQTPLQSNSSWSVGAACWILCFKMGPCGFLASGW